MGFQIDDKLEKYAAAVLVIMMITVFLLQGILFINQNVRPFFTDSQLRHSLSFHARISGCPLQGYQGYPPLTYLVSSFLYSAFGKNYTVARLGILAFSLIFGLSLYGIGREIGGSPVSGLTVMAFGLGSPHILNFSRLYYLDFPEAAMTSLAIYLMIKSRAFKNTLYSILAGIAVGLAFLTKWSALVFITLPFFAFLSPLLCKKRKQLIPFLILWIVPGTVLLRLWHYYNLPPETDFGHIWRSYYTWNVLAPVVVFIGLTFWMEKPAGWIKERLKGYSPSREVLNFFRSGLIAAALGGLWLVRNMLVFKEKMLVDMTWPRSTIEGALGLNHFLQTGFTLLPLFLLSGTILIMVLSKTDKYKKYIAGVFIVNVIFAMTAFIAIGYGTFRYFLSLLIFTSVLGGAWTGRAGKPGRAVAAVVFIMAMLAIPGWMIFSPKNTAVKFVLPYSDPAKSSMINTSFVTGERPDSRNYDLNLLYKALMEDSKRREVPGKVIAFFHDKSSDLIHVETIQYNLKKYGIIRDDSHSTALFFEHVQYFHYGELHRRLPKIRRFIILHDKKSQTAPVLEYLKRGRQGYRIKTYSKNMPDGTIITLIIFKPHDYRDYINRMQALPDD